MFRERPEIYGISIHAPTKGATCPDCGQRLKWEISIHAPTKGATTSDQIQYDIAPDFNPRSHEGSD